MNLQKKEAQLNATKKEQRLTALKLQDKLNSKNKAAPIKIKVMESQDIDMARSEAPRKENKKTINMKSSNLKNSQSDLQTTGDAEILKVGLTNRDLIFTFIPTCL
jgi:flagellar biosynthesis GTPase FlhF